MTMVDEILAQAAALIAEAHRLSGQPQDVFEPMDVVWFTHTFNRDRYYAKGRTYTYVALKIGDRWFLSGTSGSGVDRMKTWDELVAFADEGSLWYVSEWTQLP